MERAQVEALLGRRVFVYAPAEASAPRSYLHDCEVTLLHFSPRQSEVVCTDRGPLQWTRTKLALNPELVDTAP